MEGTALIIDLPGIEAAISARSPINRYLGKWYAIAHHFYDFFKAEQRAQNLLSKSGSLQ